MASSSDPASSELWSSDLHLDEWLARARSRVADDALALGGVGRLHRVLAEEVLCGERDVGRGREHVHPRLVACATRRDVADLRFAAQHLVAVERMRVADRAHTLEA